MVLEAITLEGEMLARQVFIGPPPYSYDGAVNRLYAYSPQFRQSLAERVVVRIAVWTEIPRQSGLEGSSLLALAQLGREEELVEVLRAVVADARLEDARV